MDAHDQDAETWGNVGQISCEPGRPPLTSDDEHGPSESMLDHARSGPSLPEATAQRRNLTLATLSTSCGAPWTPVQVQKVFFLLDERAAGDLGGKHWNYTPYDYGPFDATVYADLEALEREGLVAIETPPLGVKTFRLTEAGQATGAELFAQIPDNVRGFVQKLGDWIRSLTFAQLVSAIYRDFPAMKVNSVFRG